MNKEVYILAQNSLFGDYGLFEIPISLICEITSFLISLLQEAIIKYPFLLSTLNIEDL